jgi:hypothetical protein
MQAAYFYLVPDTLAAGVLLLPVPNTLDPGGLLLPIADTLDPGGLLLYLILWTPAAYCYT